MYELKLKSKCREIGPRGSFVSSLEEAVAIVSIVDCTTMSIARIDSFI